MKKTALLLLVLVLVAGMFTGCGKDDSDKNSSGTSSVGASEFDTSSVKFSTADVTYIDTDGSSVYVIVRPDDASTTTAAAKLFKSMKDTLGTNVKNTLETASDGADAYEVLVGATNRAESTQAYNYLLEVGTARSDDYIICTIGKKIVINAISDGALSAGVDYFIANFLSKDGVKGGIHYINKTADTSVNYTINGAQLGKFNIVRPHYNSSYLTQVEMEKIVDNALTAGKYNIDIVEDMYVSEGLYEIIVGNTNRAGVEQITDHDEYRITVKGHKVYLNGGSPHATAVAVTEFYKLLFSKDVTDADSMVGSYAQTVATYDDTQYYVHKWGDDFDGTEIDTTKWDNIVSEKHYSSLGDGTESWRIDACTYVENGKLIQLQYFDEAAGKYYGGTIRSNNHMRFMGGYLEHSVITPDLAVSWNTLWLGSAQSNGVIVPEVDLNENFGNAGVTNFNAHTWPAAGNEYGWEHRSFDSLKPNEKRFNLPEADRATHNLNTEFHTFGFLWTQDYIAFTGDGQIYVDLDLNQKGYEDFKMAFTVEAACKVIIAASPGTTGQASSVTPDQWESAKSNYVSDYVHIYQLNDGWSTMDIDW